jgi:hypothetical protein
MDLALMDVCVGYFGRIHIATESLISAPFVRVLTSLAGRQAAQVAAVQSAQATEDADTGLPAVAGADDDDFWGLDLLGNNFDLEDWGTFSLISPDEPAIHVETLL